MTCCSSLFILINFCINCHNKIHLPPPCCYIDCWWRKPLASGPQEDRTVLTLAIKWISHPNTAAIEAKVLELLLVRTIMPCPHFPLLFGGTLWGSNRDIVLQKMLPDCMKDAFAVHQPQGTKERWTIIMALPCSCLQVAVVHLCSPSGWFLVCHCETS